MCVVLSWNIISISRNNKILPYKIIADISETPTQTPT